MKPNYASLEIPCPRKRCSSKVSVHVEEGDGSWVTNCDDCGTKVAFDYELAVNNVHVVDEEE